MKEFQYELHDFQTLPNYYGRDQIYEVLAKKSDRERKKRSYQEISPTVWQVSASVNENSLPLLKDGDFETRWSTKQGKQVGDFLLIKFKEPVNVAKVSFYQGRYGQDFALNLRVQTSFDGEEWRTEPHSYSPGEFSCALVSTPIKPVQNVYLD